jgi:hypothetical protein
MGYFGDKKNRLFGALGEPENTDFGEKKYFPNGPHRLPNEILSELKYHKKGGMTYPNDP